MMADGLILKTCKKNNSCLNQTIVQLCWINNIT